MVERIRILLESRQLTPTQFADLIGVARPIISHILSGRNKPSLEVVQRILAAMPDLSMAWLLNGTEPMLNGGSPPMAPAARPVAAPAAPELVAGAQVPAAAVPAPVTQAAVVGNITENQHNTVVAGGAEPFSHAAVEFAATPVAQATAVPPAIPVARRPMPRRFPVKQATEPVVGPPPVVSPVLPAAKSSGADIPLAARATVGTVALNPAVLSNATGNDGDAEALRKAQPAVAAGPEATAATLASAAPEVPAERPVAALPGTAAVPAAAPAPAAISAPASGAAPTLASDMTSALFTGAEKPIRRIVIFYRDGSFADYQPE